MVTEPASPRAGTKRIFPLADGIGDRQVMDRNDAINGFNVILLQRSGDGIADGYHFAHCSPFLSRTSG